MAGKGLDQPRTTPQRSAPDSPLAALIRRVEAATAGNRELDAAVADYFDPPRVDVDVVLPEDFGPPDGFGRWDPDFTTSLDDALSLVERCLPEALYEIKALPHRRGHGASLWSADPSVDRMLSRADAPTPALALCLAMLRALELHWKGTRHG